MSKKESSKSFFIIAIVVVAIALSFYILPKFAPEETERTIYGEKIHKNRIYTAMNAYDQCAIKVKERFNNRLVTYWQDNHSSSYNAADKSFLVALKVREGNYTKNREVLMICKIFAKGLKISSIDNATDNSASKLVKNISRFFKGAVEF